MPIKQIPVYERILKANDFIAEENRRLFVQKKVCVISLMSSPGAGKTSLLERTAERLLEKKLRMAVLVGDLATTRDAERLSKYPIPAVQLTTGGACHLEAQQIAQAVKDMDLDGLDFLFIENVGNLVCPASYDLGESSRVVMLSVPEGDDKPQKYPTAFRRSQLLILNKIDLLPYLSYDVGKVFAEATALNPRLQTLSLSCTSGEGLDGWIEYLEAQRVAMQARENGAG